MEAWSVLARELRRALTTPGYAPSLGDGAQEAEELLCELLALSRRAEEERNKNQLFLSSIVDHIPIMLFVKDAKELRLQLWNQAGEELLGIPRERLIGKTDFDLFPAEEASQFQAKDREVLGERKLVEIEESITSPKGLRWLHTKKIPLLGDDGRPEFLLGISEDITSQREAKEALLRAKEAAEDAARVKSEFFANVSHELRTPLTLIAGPLDCLSASPQLTPAHRESLLLVRRNVARLSSLVDDLLDFSRLEANKFQVEWAWFDLISYAKQLIDDAIPTAQLRGLQLDFTHTGEAREGLLDQKMFGKLLLNLLSNALKFTPRGGRITVTLDLSKEILLSVKDTGVGIPREKLPLLFRRFQQLDNSMTRQYEGSGLGLALVKEFTEKMGGVVGVESTEGEGARFWVRLPRRAQEKRELAPPTAAPSSLLMLTPSQPIQAMPLDPNKGLLLIAEDNGDMRTYLRQLLEGEYNIIYANNGKEALEKAKMFVPDIVLSDVMMPLLDGVSLARQMKDDVVLRIVPVILLTARVDEESVVTGLEEGADDYITKPFSPAELRARLRAALRLNRMSKELALTTDELKEARTLLVQIESFSMAGQLADFVKQTLNAPLALLQQNLKQVESLLASTSRGISQLDLLGEGLQLLNQLPELSEPWSVAEKITEWVQSQPAAPRRIIWNAPTQEVLTTLHPEALRVSLLSIFACLQASPPQKKIEEIKLMLASDERPTLVIAAPWFDISEEEAKVLLDTDLSQTKDATKLSISLAAQLMQHFDFNFRIDSPTKTFTFFL